MIADNIAWVLLRKKINISRYPVIGESVRILTYPAGIDRIFAYRDYFMYDESGAVIASASSTWTLFCLEKRSLIRIPPQYHYLKQDDQTKVLPVPDGQYASLTRADYTSSYIVNYFDLDWNNHTNNLVYVRIMLNALPLEWHKKYELTQLSFQIKSECQYGEKLVTQAQIDKDKIIFLITKEDGSTAMLADGMVREK